MVGRSIQTYLYATMFFVTTLLISSYNASSFAMRHKLHLELLYTWKFYLKHRPHCTFVTSKTRLTPMKTKLSPVKKLSLPKLLLNVAVLEIRLDKVIIKEVHLTIQNTTFWTDSVLVLQYIRKGFKIYSTNQVSGIKEETFLNNDATSKLKIFLLTL